MAGAALAVWVLLLAVPGVRDTLSIAEGRVVAWIGEQRADGAPVVERLYDVAYTWTSPVVGWLTLATLLLFRRIRHAILYLTCVVVSVATATLLAEVVQRPRPYDVVLLGRWEGFSHPAWTMAVFASVLFASTRSLAPPGTPRRSAGSAAAVVVVLLGSAELYLGVAHPSDVLLGATLGVTVTLLLFFLLAPDEAFPVAYRRGGNTAHLDVGGPRGRAIRGAIEDQLGVAITDVRPIGLEGSAGSTPLKLTVADDAAADDAAADRPSALFAKLYAKTHLRSDRWYKFGRMLLYGRLEDETRFSTVRRLVEYEDYLALRMTEAGITVPRSHGIVEITPGREYVLVTDFLEGYVEIGDAEVDEAVIDGALTVVRRLWDGGLAHRDVKPSNVMTRGEEVALIDVAFGQVRPSPWRQAIDLANMMLVLALRSDAPTVYARALASFTPDEVAEAFAASRGVTLPSQVRQELKADGRDLLGEFRSLAPDRAPIRLQRWSVRRAAALVGTAVASVLAIGFGIGYLDAAGMLP